MAIEEKTILTEQESIVRYWHSVELLQPQSAPKLKKRSNRYEAFIHDTPIQRPVVPWVEQSVVSRQVLPKKRVWSHTLYAHLYDSRLVAEKLQEIYGADQGYREPQFRESALFAAKFTMAGRMVDGSFVLSSEAWFLGRVLTGKDWTRGFEADQKTIADHAKTFLAGQVSGSALRELTQWILRFVGVADFFGDMDRHRFRFRSQPLKPDKPESEDDPLNSFLLDDLADVAESIGKGVKGEALDQYLRRHDPQPRLHVDDNRASLPLMGRLMPDAYANSCWPTERHLGLVHSQQLAVNTILSTLADGQGLLGVNGPPGTGKTTLLRDLIAAVVTSRADALAKLRRASDGFVSNGREAANDGGKQQICFKLNPMLYGFEIVVASTNNGAVENVTLELPQRDKIDESWLPEAEYFAELGELVTGKPAWGLISGALGSKTRRTKFVERYFYGQRPSGSKDKAGSEAEDDTEVESEEDLDNIVEGLFSTPTAEAESGEGSDDQEDDAAPEKEQGPKGFLGWLSANAEVNANRSSEQRQVLWQQAVSDYEVVKAEARKVCADASRIRELIPAILQARKTIADNSKTLHALEQKQTDVVNQLSRLDADEGRPANLALKQCLDALGQHQARKPGFWANLFSLWRTRRDWNTTQELLESQRDLAKTEFARIARLTKQLDTSKQSLEKQIAEARRTLQRLRDKEQALTQDATCVANACRADHLLAWLHSGVIGRGDAIELAEPWRIEGWRQARARVFIQALKLHQTFFELEASRMRSNLFLINGLLTGSRFQGLSHDAIRSAWVSLFMVVPVLSSTFASFARSFGSLGASEIGWLLVDEAGQAPPQAAVGALWRSRRALLVGDPLQLKPIVTVSDAVLEHMRTRYRVDTHWLPNQQSAQTLADEATPWGRMAGPADSKTWVGLPLVVHRRCDKPMHELANRIAYDGAMVYGTLAPRPDKETRASLLTGWIQASGTSEGNWVPAEGQALRALLALLHEDGVEAKDISVITPFKAVQQNLKRMLGSKMVSGTIHTMQGKEAPVVIMVLGGNTAGSGARNWAVSEPNLLNVAATRAKRRFYVIGDRNDWKHRALFCDVMDLLPLQTISAREQGPMPLLQ
ncbi:ATP-binding protein [Burkholderia multivorans]|uniref:DEAD/DEAH box helicase n=1 Tax=Burkholderia multivorans TaxID=87883 RepID=UPI001C24A6C3|nr:DEAD/DEAH box helicase [Burkholderia multivorans]MBU9132956.1 ATP-binding protein [Burkholderia multivorans]MBU9373496.1 ATP-binding protein [Burkholderia multivorans]